MVSPGLTFNNSTFCSHSVFMWFVWIWGQTAIISLYNINWLVFITQIYPFKTKWLLYVPPGLTFNNSTFCPHSVFVCYVLIWEQTAIISLHSISWFAFNSSPSKTCLDCLHFKRKATRPFETAGTTHPTSRRNVAEHLNAHYNACIHDELYEQCD